MKICKFMIEVSRKDSSSSIIDDIPNCYLFRKTKEDYLEECKKEHEKMSEHTKQAFGKDAVIAWTCVQGINYFIRKHNENVDSSSSVCLDVLLVVESEKLPKSVCVVFSDIKKHLNDNSMSVTFCSNAVNVYLVKDRDLLDKYYFIKALFYEKKWSSEDKNRLIASGIIALLIFIAYLSCDEICSILGVETQWLSTTLLGIFFSIPVVYVLEFLFLKKIKQETIIVNDFDQEWFSQDSAAESTFNSNVGSIAFESPKDISQQQVGGIASKGMKKNKGGVK